MRKLEKRPKPSEDLEKHLSEWADQWRTLRESNPKAEFRWYERQKNGEARSARLWLLDELLPWSKSHCAFCDGMGGTTQWPVEHFKPKATYPDHAYEWTNLYPCCERCQGKGSEWVDTLLRPDEDGYEFGSFFYYDFTAPEGVALCELPGQERAATLIRLYGLDDTERRKARMAEWHFWDPPPHDDPHACSTGEAAEVQFWEQACRMRQLCVERYRSGHLNLDDRPYRDLGEEILRRLASAA